MCQSTVDPRHARVSSLCRTRGEGGAKPCLHDLAASEKLPNAIVGADIVAPAGTRSAKKFSAFPSLAQPLKRGWPRHQKATKRNYKISSHKQQAFLAVTENTQKFEYRIITGVVYLWQYKGGVTDVAQPPEILKIKTLDKIHRTMCIKDKSSLTD